MLDTWTSLVLVSRPDTTLTSRAGSQPRSRPSWPAAASLSPPGRKNDLHAARKAASLARPPRLPARSAERSSSAATSSSGPTVARGAVPGPAIGIQPGIDRGRQSLVHPAAIGLRGTLIDRRAHQRVPERHPRFESCAGQGVELIRSPPPAIRSCGRRCAVLGTTALGPLDGAGVHAQGLRSGRGSVERGNPCTRLRRTFQGISGSRLRAGSLRKQAGRRSIRCVPRPPTAPRERRAAADTSCAGPSWCPSGTRECVVRARVRPRAHSAPAAGRCCDGT